METLLVTDTLEGWMFLSELVPIVHATDYLSNDQFFSRSPLRVINLCQSYQYQTIGYYVSLLAQARDQRAIPSVLNIQDVLNRLLSKELSEELEDEIQLHLKDIKSDAFVLSVYFGQNMAKCHTSLAKKLYHLFQLPLLRFTFKKKKQWKIQDIKPLSITEVPESHLVFLKEAALSFFQKKRFHQWKKKQKFHDLAILIDPNEHNAPSDSDALEQFVIAGEAVGLHIDFIEKHDIKILPEYDGLFIRATTGVDHFTYRFARRALQDNLVVIDDPQSIVKCTNKVYLAELMRSHQILTPETCFISKYDPFLPTLSFPCVLKKPDSAFSQGVIKIENYKMLEKALAQFFKSSDLILAQPFIPTEYDWRIGILDHKPLFACRYYMAKDHWQIYNWDSSAAETEGHFDTIPVEQVPDAVLKTALKTTRLIGDSLYGVDIKSHKNKHYVIEVNDNPNIDGNVEDQILGKTLYQQIMSTFLQRIRKKHGYL